MSPPKGAYNTPKWLNVCLHTYHLAQTMHVRFQPYGGSHLVFWPKVSWSVISHQICTFFTISIPNHLAPKFFLNISPLKIFLTILPPKIYFWSSRPQKFFDHLSHKNIFYHLTLKILFDDFAPEKFFLPSHPQNCFLPYRPKNIFDHLDLKSMLIDPYCMRQIWVKP